MKLHEMFLGHRVIHLWKSEDGKNDECIRCGVQILKTPKNHFATSRVHEWNEPTSFFSRGMVNCTDPHIGFYEVHNS